jgi:SAM-dependent methyltransferase
MADTAISSTPVPAHHDCLVCGSDDVRTFLDLGDTAYANKFLTAEELSQPEPSAPLRVGFCPRCHHVQLTDMAPPSDLFEHYLYVSSASSTLTEHLEGLARTIVEREKLSPNDLVVDVGCNDGTLLAGFRKAGIEHTVGIDPAANLAPLAREKGIEVKTAFFGPETAKEMRSEWRAARVITLTNSFPHIPDLEGLLRGFDSLLTDDGVIVLEAHYLGDLLDMMAFDTVYHEHVSYWALGPAVRLFASHGFVVAHVERLPIHHGQLRLWVRRAGQAKATPAVRKLLAEEAAKGFDRLETYENFAQQIGGIKDSIRNWLADCRANGKTVAAYGAPAKGNTLLSFLELGPDDLMYIADRSPLKQGRFTPGTHIPVVPAERLVEDQPDYVLILAWNFVDEIVAQQSAYLDAGGRFFVPVPELKQVAPKS